MTPMTVFSIAVDQLSYHSEARPFGDAENKHMQGWVLYSMLDAKCKKCGILLGIIFFVALRRW
jgi:hypothetical protein